MTSMIFIFRVELEYLPSSTDPPLPRQATLHKDFLFVQFSSSRAILSFQTQPSFSGQTTIFTLSFQFSPQATLSRPRAHRSEVLAHITDWLPTLLGLAGGHLRTFSISVFLYFIITVRRSRNWSGLR